ncbi:hypothetical protein JCM3775_006757 [Rhodotorula graminis]
MLGFHHFGTFLLFAATILLIIASITSPVVNNIALARATVSIGVNQIRANFGVFGYCLVENGNSDVCTSSQVGYQVPQVLLTVGELTGVLSSSTESAVNATTSALILHPIAAALSFLAFLIAACSDRLGFLCASLTAALACLVALAAMVLDLVLVAVVRSYLNRNSAVNAAVDVSYEVGTWLTVAAFACLFVGVFTTCCACLTDRRRRRNKY